MPSCFVQYCRQTATTFPAPKDPDLLRKWNEAVRHPTKTLTSKCAVCHIHFKPEDMIQMYIHNSLSDQRKWTLKSGAIPSVFPIDYSDQLPMPTTNSNAMTVVEPTFQFKVENIEKEIVSRTKTSIESPMPAKGLSPAGYLDPLQLSASNVTNSAIVEPSFPIRLENIKKEVVGEIEIPIESSLQAEESISASDSSDPLRLSASNFTDCSLVSVLPIQFEHVKKENSNEIKAPTETPMSARENFSYELISSFRSTTQGNREWLSVMGPTRNLRPKPLSAAERKRKSRAAKSEEAREQERFRDRQRKATEAARALNRASMHRQREFSVFREFSARDYERAQDRQRKTTLRENQTAETRDRGRAHNRASMAKQRARSRTQDKSVEASLKSSEVLVGKHQVLDLKSMNDEIDEVGHVDQHDGANQVGKDTTSICIANGKAILPPFPPTVEDLSRLSGTDADSPELKGERPLNLLGLKLPSSKWKLSKFTDPNYPTLKDQWDLHETYMLNGFPASRKMCRIMTNSQHIKFGVFYEVFDEAPSTYNSMEELQTMIDRFESAQFCPGITEDVISSLQRVSPSLTAHCLMLKRDIEGCWRSDACSRLLFETASSVCLNCNKLQESFMSKHPNQPKNKKLKSTGMFSLKINNRYLYRESKMLKLRTMKRKIVQLEACARNSTRSIKELTAQVQRQMQKKIINEDECLPLNKSDPKVDQVVQTLTFNMTTPE